MRDHLFPDRSAKPWVELAERTTKAGRAGRDLTAVRCRELLAEVHLDSRGSRASVRSGLHSACSSETRRGDGVVCHAAECLLADGVTGFDAKSTPKRAENSRRSHAEQTGSKQRETAWLNPRGVVRFHSPSHVKQLPKNQGHVTRMSRTPCPGASRTSTAWTDYRAAEPKAPGDAPPKGSGGRAVGGSNPLAPIGKAC